MTVADGIVLGVIVALGILLLWALPRAAVSYLVRSHGFRFTPRGAGLVGLVSSTLTATVGAMSAVEVARTGDLAYLFFAIILLGCSAVFFWYLWLNFRMGKFASTAQRGDDNS